ncbi:hypothetical protein HanIR_Chr06g0256721 [Helianthus annuus]|nr:hypothetical protein HanIR_Chr06g0256721 [Helianthus annuus]
MIVFYSCFRVYTIMYYCCLSCLRLLLCSVVVEFLSDDVYFLVIGCLCIQCCLVGHDDYVCGWVYGYAETIVVGCF